MISIFMKVCIPYNNKWYNHYVQEKVFFHELSYSKILIFNKALLICNFRYENRINVLTGSMKTFFLWHSKKKTPNGTAKLTKVRK